MPYVFSMTARMATIAACCVLFLCVLLFLLGVEIGARYASPTSPAVSPATMTGGPVASERAPLPASTDAAASAAAASNAS